MNDEIEGLIREYTADELYNRGYGEQRFGSFDMKNDMIALLLVSAALLMLFWSGKKR